MNKKDNTCDRRLALRLRRRHYHMAEPVSATLASPGAGHAHAGHHAHRAESEKAADHLREQLARMQAEFENFRKRTRRDEQQKLDLANQELLKQLLPVLDNFDRAIQNPGESVPSLLSGIDMVRKQLADILKQQGLEKVEAVGQSFNPNLHEAVTMEPASDDNPANTVTCVFQEGYTLKGRLIRPAMVKVAQ